MAKTVSTTKRPTAASAGAPAKAPKTGDGRDPLPEAAYTGEVVEKGLAGIAPEFGHLFNEGTIETGPTKGPKKPHKDSIFNQPENEDDDVEDLDDGFREDSSIEVGDEEEAEEEEVTPSPARKKQKPRQKPLPVQAEEGDEEAEELVGQEDVEDASAEDGLEDLGALRQQIAELRAELALVTPQDQQAQGQVPQVSPNQPVSNLVAGNAFRLNELSQDQFDDIISSPAKFNGYLQEAMNYFGQHVMVNLQPVAQDAVRMELAVTDFFNRAENKDLRSTAMRNYVMNQAVMLEKRGEFKGLIPTLERAADLTRTALKISTQEGRKQVIGRRGIEAATQSAPKPPQRRFPSGSGKGAAQRKEEGREAGDQLTKELVTMLRVSGRQ